MKGSALAFSFFSLLILLTIVVSSIVGGIGIFTEQAVNSEVVVYLITSTILLIVNITIVFGLKKRRSWAYKAGGFEGLGLLIYAFYELLLSVIVEGTFSIVLIIISMGLLLSLYLDFKSKPINKGEIV